MKKSGFCEMLRTSQKPGKMEGRNPVGNHGSYGCIENSLIHSNENSHYSRNHRVLLSVFPPAGAGRPVKPVVRKFVFDVIAQRKEFVNKKIQKSKVSIFTYFQFASFLRFLFVRHAWLWTICPQPRVPALSASLLIL